jgi:hypothetical protein
MDVSFVKGRILLGEFLFYEKVLRFPPGGIDGDRVVTSVISNPHIISQLRVVEDNCGKRETKIYVDLANLLNDIIGVSANVVHRPPTAPHPLLPNSTSRLKRFFVDFHKYKANDSRRHTDLAMVYSGPDDNTTPFSYSDVLCPIKIRRKGNSTPMEGVMADQIMALFAEQPDRNFILSLTIQFPNFRVWRWDRSGVISSVDMDIFKEFKTFIWLIRRLTQMDRNELGYDTAFHFAGKALHADGQFNMTIVDPTRGVFDIVAEQLIWSTKLLFGRTTRCWKVRITNPPTFTGSYILKQSFVDAGRKLTEDDVYTGIENHVKAGVSRRIAYERVSEISSFRDGIGMEDVYDAKTKQLYTFEDRRVFACCFRL